MSTLIPTRHAALTLEQAAYQANAGLMSGAEWRAYAHAWQTGAPRFELRVCHCVDCCRAHPSPEYRPVYRLEWSLL